MNTQITYNQSIQRRSRGSIRIILPIDAAEIERVVLNGITFGLRSANSGSAEKRVILSANKRIELWERIDERFREIRRIEPGLQKYQVYRRISEKSLEWFGIFLGPRQVEGKHASYEKFLRSRRGKDKRF